MKRRFVALVLGLLMAGVAWPAWGQTDLSVQQFFLPGTNTSGYRVHANTTEMNLTLAGDLYARGGYKVAYVFSHGSAAAANATTHAPVAGLGLSSSYRQLLTPIFQMMPFTGSVRAVTIWSSHPLTGGSAHAEATIFQAGLAAPFDQGIGTGLIARIGVAGSGYLNDQVAASAQGPNVDVFNNPQQIGCRIGTQTGLVPLPILVCTVVVEY